MITPIAFDIPVGIPTRPENKICGIRISGIKLVAISEVFTMDETKSPREIPTRLVTIITTR
jgi:hypothetical protein